MNDNDLLTPEKALECLGGAVSSTGTLANWRYRGVGPKWIKIGRAVLYRRADLNDYIARHSHDPEGVAQ